MSFNGPQIDITEEEVVFDFNKKELKPYVKLADEVDDALLQQLKDLKLPETPEEKAFKDQGMQSMIATWVTGKPSEQGQERQQIREENKRIQDAYEAEMKTYKERLQALTDELKSQHLAAYNKSPSPQELADIEDLHLTTDFLKLRDKVKENNEKNKPTTEERDRYYEFFRRINQAFKTHYGHQTTQHLNEQIAKKQKANTPEHPKTVNYAMQVAKAKRDAAEQEAKAKRLAEAAKAEAAKTKVSM